MRFCFDVSPLLKTTADFARANSSASVSTSSLFAFPSTGAQRMRTFTASPISESIPALDERGCARTFITTPSGVSERHSILRIAPVGERHERRRLVTKAKEFIDKHATEGITPGDVAIHLGISRPLLDLRFREMGDATVGELILERRLAALSAMLRRSKSPIYRATKDCGFGSVNHAKAVFKQRFGGTMREYRNGVSA